MLLQLRPEFVQLYGRDRATAFEALMTVEGTVYREADGRSTRRFSNSLGSFFIKSHRGVGWIEILKNIAQLRAPVVGARNEWRAIKRLGELGVDTMTLVGYGRKGVIPSTMQSFVVTEELTNVTPLTDLTRDWHEGCPDVPLKQVLIDKVADIARTLHDNGVNHRDLYICHFLLDSEMRVAPTAEDVRLYLIDLHRVQIRRKTPHRWRVKDVAAIYFSAMDIGLTRRDLLRFVRRYGHGGLRTSLARERRFWRDVEARAKRLYRSEWGRPAPSL